MRFLPPMDMGEKIHVQSTNLKSCSFNRPGDELRLMTIPVSEAIVIDTNQEIKVKYLI